MVKRSRRKALSYKVILTPAEEGGFTVTVPALPGCVSEGNTYEKALKNIREAVEGYLNVCRRYGDPIPPSDIMQDVVRVSV